MLYQKSSCTKTGVARKNQMYSQLAPETSGLGDSRMTASSTPSSTPMVIALTVSSSVMTTPSRMRWSNRNSPTTCHSSCLFVATEWISEAANSRIRAPATQRPGRRTGTALISSGRRPCSSLSVATGPDTGYLMSCSALGAVDHRIGDRPALQFPFLEDRRVGAVGHRPLQRFEHRFGHAVSLRQRQAVRCCAEGGTRANRDAQLPDLINDDRRVGVVDFGAAAGQREVGVVLSREDQQLDRLAGFLALLVLLFRFFELGRAF